jgi:hypothetical protein
MRRRDLRHNAAYYEAVTRAAAMKSPVADVQQPDQALDGNPAEERVARRRVTGKACRSFASSGVDHVPGRARLPGLEARATLG